MSSEPKIHPAELHEPATNAANVAGAIASGQPFVTDDAGAVVLVSTEAEAVPVCGACEPVCEPCKPAAAEANAKADEPAEKPKRRRAKKK